MFLECLISFLMNKIGRIMDVNNPKILRIKDKNPPI
jgi:hypothetical protein